jgi:hypothetical protein
VPAAAVIPAPIAYIKVVAVKKLVVEFLARAARPPSGALCDRAILVGKASAFTCRRSDPRPLL